jgi:ribosomal protein S15P/S13E
MNNSVIPEPNYDDPKEVYAFFGLTFYCAQLLEQGFINFVVALHAKRIVEFRTVTIEALFEKFDKRTFGNVLREIRKYIDIPTSLAANWEKAWEKRNYLAHHFWRTHDIDLLSKSGQQKMIDELRELLIFLKGVDKELDKEWIMAWEKLGISRELIIKETERIISLEKKKDFSA